MPIYRAKTKCFVGNTLRNAGEEFEYNGPAFSHIERLGKAEPEVVEGDAIVEEAAPAKRKWTPKAKRTASSKK